MVSAIVPATPLLPFDVAGFTLLAKVESLQPVGSFKVRGAWTRLSRMSDAERARGVVAFSSGNHAHGVAWAARRLGMAATIVMPDDAPVVKRAATQALGAEIIDYDRDTQSREVIAATLAAERGAILVPSFDDADVIEGQGSAGIEILAQLADLGLTAPRRIVTPCGGGGLAAGLALACPMAEIITVEPEGWEDMARSLALGRIVPVDMPAPKTACDALQTVQVSSLTFAVLQAAGARGVAVSESAIAATIRRAARDLRLVLEPGGAVALAALWSGRIPPESGTVVILSGGNIDPAVYQSLLAARKDQG